MGAVNPYRIPCPPEKAKEPKIPLIHRMYAHWKRWALWERMKHVRSEFWWIVGFMLMTLYPMAATVAYTIVTANYFYTGRWFHGLLYTIIVLGYAVMACSCAVTVKRIAAGEK